MTMRLKERELVAVGISVAAGCKPCTDYHLKAVRKAKATDDEITQATAVAMGVRRSAQNIMEAYGLSQLGATHRVEDCVDTETHRLKELVSIGAAFAVNCTTNLEAHLAAATSVAISDDDIQGVLMLAQLIKGKAASHVEKLIKISDTDESVQPRKQWSTGCCGFGGIANLR